MMNAEEEFIFEYLKKEYGNDVIFEPDGNIPPDFLIPGGIAIEVRRLNQHFFNSGKVEGLEKLSFPLWDAFQEVLRSFGKDNSGNGYWVFLDYKRPLHASIHEIKGIIAGKLKLFIQEQPLSDFPYMIKISDEVKLLLHPSQLQNGYIFEPGGSTDDDEGSWLIPLYIDNIRHCINEKNPKIQEYLHKYKGWWLYLVDNMEWDLDDDDLTKVAENIYNFGDFEKISVISRRQEKVLISFTKK